MEPNKFGEDMDINISIREKQSGKVHITEYNIEELNLARTCIKEKEKEKELSDTNRPIGAIPNDFGGYFYTIDQYCVDTKTKFEDLIRTCIKEKELDSDDIHIPNKFGGYGYYQTFEEYLEANGIKFEDLIRTCIRE
jgi:hypothetical protein